MIEKVVVPDIGEFQDVPIIEILVNVGDNVEIEQSLITLESDKATMEIPSPLKGVINKIHVKLGDKVSQNSSILEIETRESPKSKDKSLLPKPDTPSFDSSINNYECDLVVIGAGPGGYSAAFRAADLGLKVILVEKHNTLGGVCLNVGCIPSKALLHLADIIYETKSTESHGLKFSPPKIDHKKIRQWVESVVGKLTTGLSSLAKQRKVVIEYGEAKFKSKNQIEVAINGKLKTISFKNAIIAVGSHSTEISTFPDDSRIINSTGALQLKDIPKSMLVIGGGIIGLEMASVYSSLGSKITIVELLPNLIPGADSDLIQPLIKKLKADNIEIKTDTKVTSIKSTKKELIVSLQSNVKNSENPQEDKQSFDKVLVAVGRRPNGKRIGVENAGVLVNEQGFINVDNQMRTNVANIFAIGDVVGDPMLAHKATHQAKVAAEVVAGKKSVFEPVSIPSVAYTNPEIAWIGLSENQAKDLEIKYQKAVFPWVASGRAISINRFEGITKIIYNPENHRILGGGIVGKNAGELIGELCLAIEMGADITDLALTIHPHPTLSETIGFAAEMAEGTITDLYLAKKK